MSKTKKIVLVLVALASAVALFAFFHTDYYSKADKLQEEEIFLEVSNRPEFMYDDLDQAHMPGEPFFLTVKVQYDTDKVEIFTEYLDHADYRPLEPTGNKVLEIETVQSGSTNIDQLTYSIELVAIQAIPGAHYDIPSMELKFRRKTDKSAYRYTLNIAPQSPIHVGSPWGGSYEQAFLRPMKGKIASAAADKQMLYLAGSAIFLFSAMALAAPSLFAAIKQKGNMGSLFASKIHIFEVFEKYGDLNWLKRKSARERMHEVENFAFFFATKHGLVENSVEFWTKDDERWTDMINRFNTAHSREDVDYDSVLEAFYLTKELIAKDALADSVS